MTSPRIPGRLLMASLVLVLSASWNSVWAQQPIAVLEGPIVTWTNFYRQQTGLAPLQVNPALTYAARLHAWHMALREEMAHDLAGSTLADRARRAGYMYLAVGENIAWCEGYADPAWQCFSSWMRSPGHYRNLMGPQYTEIGVGVFQSRSGKIYACQVFGTPAMMPTWHPGP